MIVHYNYNHLFRQLAFNVWQSIAGAAAVFPHYGVGREEMRARARRDHMRDPTTRYDCLFNQHVHSITIQPPTIAARLTRLFDSLFRHAVHAIHFDS